MRERISVPLNIARVNFSVMRLVETSSPEPRLSRADGNFNLPSKNSKRGPKVRPGPDKLFPAQFVDMDNMGRLVLRNGPKPCLSPKSFATASIGRIRISHGRDGLCVQHREDCRQWSSSRRMMEAVNSVSKSSIQSCMQGMPSCTRGRSRIVVKQGRGRGRGRERKA